MKNFLIWGTGGAARRILKKVNFEGNLIGFIDTQGGNLFQNKKIYLPFEVNNLDYDLLLVASSFTDEIELMLDDLGIEKSKVIFLYRGSLSQERFVNGYMKLHQIVPNMFETSDVLMQPRLLEVKRMGRDFIEHTYLADSEYISDPTKLKDYMRYRTFELIADEINDNNVIGEVAEAGVYRGDFARLINLKFSNRKLYLFDTFQGFSLQDAQDDIEKGYCNQEFLNIFTNTNVQYVMNNMKHQKNCIVRKGLFPETAKDIEETYAFVSIDLDIEILTFKALEYFYPKLAHGGFLFIHDYNHMFLGGVKAAVKKYESQYGKLIKVPMSDSGGTLIITKR